MKRNAGLSYLELLIVLMLLAVVAVLIGGAFDFVRQSKVRAIALEKQESQIILRSLLRGWVETMSPVLSENGFKGSDSGFTFLLSRGLEAKPDAQIIEVRFRIDDQASALVFLMGTSAANTIVFEENRVFESALSIHSLDYYGQTNGEPAAWHPEWQENRLPRLIRFQATRLGGTPMPPLIIRPAVAFDQSIISVLFPSPPT